MLTWFFIFFGIGAGIAILLFLLALVGVAVWFVFYAAKCLKQGWQQAGEELQARKEREGQG